MDNRKFASLESTTCFNFNNLCTKIKKDLLKKNNNLRGKALDKDILENLKSFKINDQMFDFASSKNYLGGRRWYVKCPKCKNLCLKLYLPSKYKDREQKYLCRECHKLKNESLLLGNSPKYRKVVKPLKRLEKLRAQLLKKGLDPIKAKPLLDEYERVEKDLASSPEYRLYRFQKEHGVQF